VASKRVYLAHCRSFYNWAVDEELLVHSPCRKVLAPPLKRNLPRPMSERDLGVALATADPLIHAWILVAAFTGLRACEVALMRGEHVIHGDNPYLVIPEGKGGKSRTVPLPPIVMDELANWPSYGWMWKPDGPWHYQVVSRKVGAHLRAQGIRAGMHTLRHRFGTQSYIASGRDLRMTQELLGHSSPSTTAIYTALDPREGSTVVGRLPLPAA
jgi:integrase/recombinase XerC